jgi:hypothetical protein
VYTPPSLRDCYAPALLPDCARGVGGILRVGKEGLKVGRLNDSEAGNVGNWRPLTTRAEAVAGGPVQIPPEDQGRDFVVRNA